MSLHDVVGVWCVAGAAGSIDSISVVMVKDKAYGNNPHSEDNVGKKIISRVYFPSFHQQQGRNWWGKWCGCPRWQNLRAGKMVGKINILN